VNVTATMLLMPLGNNHVLRADSRVGDIFAHVEQLAPAPFDVEFRDAGFFPKPPIVPFIVFVAKFAAVIRRQGRIRILKSLRGAAYPQGLLRRNWALSLSWSSPQQLWDSYQRLL